MNFYYVDPSVSSSGTGAINSPFKSMAALINSGISHPCTICLKRGTTLYENANFGKLLANLTGSMSYFTAYGTGPLPKWFNESYIPAGTSLDGYTYRGMQMTMRDVRSLTISNIEFHARNDVLAPTGSPVTYIRAELPAATSDIDAEVWVKNCLFFGSPISRSGKFSAYESIVEMRVSAGARARVNRFGVKDCEFHNVHRCINMIGNHSQADDITDNSKGTYYSRGVQVENIVMTGISKAGCQFAGVESLNSPYVKDNYQSVMRNISYSKYRWDNVLEHSSAMYADAGFWTWRCNRVMIDNITGGGMYPSVTDNELIDFDYCTWDSVARGIKSYNNGASVLFMGNSSLSVQGGSRAKYTDYSSVYTPAQWFYERRNGQGNNIVEYSYFFNDGVQRLPTPNTGYQACANIRSGNINHNNIVRNCVFIDTVSRTKKYLINNNNLAITSSEPPRLKIINCAYIAKYNDGLEMLPTITDTATYSAAATTFTNTLIYSMAWTSDNLAAALTLLKANATCSNVIAADPKIGFIPSQPPQSLSSLKKLVPMPSSPLRGAGVYSGVTDMDGSVCNDIWWMAIPY